MTSDAAESRRQHPGYLAIGGARHARAIVPVAIAIVLGGHAIGLLGVAVLVAGAIAYAVVEWRVTRYAVLDGALHVHTGVLRRSERVIPASRISALDTQRGLLQRVFGLVAVRVQTPGGGKRAEVELAALTSADAERLRRELGHAGAAGAPAVPAAVAAGSAPVADGTPVAGATSSRAGGAVGAGAIPGAAAPAPPAVAPPDARPTLVYRLTGRELVIAALTGPQIGVIGVVVASLAGRADDLLPDRLHNQAGDALAGSSATTIVLLVLAGIAVAAIAAIIATVLAFAELTVTRDDRRLRLTRGLITERTGTIPLDRVQGVRVLEGPLRQPLGYATVQVEVAGYRNEDQRTRTLVPLVRRSALPELLPRILPGLEWSERPLHRPPPRGRRRFLTVPIVVGLVGAAAVVVAVASVGVTVGLVAVAVVPVGVGALVGGLRARDAGWRVDGDLVVLRWRALARSTLVVRGARIQLSRTHATPPQRLRGLATVHIGLASGRGGRVRHLDADVADGVLRDVAQRTSPSREAPARAPSRASSAAPSGGPAR